MLYLWHSIVKYLAAPVKTISVVAMVTIVMAMTLIALVFLNSAPQWLTFLVFKPEYFQDN